MPVNGLRALLIALAMATATPAAAETPDKDRCADAYEAAQRLERAGKLVEALSEANLCANDACPALLRAECIQWVSPLRVRQSSLVVEAHDAAGHELYDVSVRVDGSVVQERLAGRAFFVDPGPHTLRIVSAAAGHKDVDVMVREGEQGRRLVIHFAPRVVAPETSESAAHPPRPVPTLAWVFGGVGVAALGGFTYFGLSGHALENTLDRDCSPRCADERVDAVRTQYIVADVALGVGLVSLGVAAWLWLGRHRH